MRTPRGLNRKTSARIISNLEALRLIKEIHQKSKGRYGSPKIAIELQNRGIQISRPRVARIMKAHGIKSVVHKRFRTQTTDSNHNYPVAKNLLDRNFAPEKTGKAWVSDITARAAPLHQNIRGVVIFNDSSGSGGS